MSSTRKPARHLAAAVAALALALPATGRAQTAPAAPKRAYMATAISQAPGQPVQEGRVVKSGTDIRLEYSRGGRRVIQIIRPTRGEMFMLDPEARTWFVIRGEPQPDATADGYQSPCPAPAPQVRCEMKGTAVSSGITAERWLITAPGQTRPAVILWDPARRRALEQEAPDGTKMVTRFAEMTTYEGRPVERWLVTVTRPGQPEVKGEWWFDPELRVAVREFIEGGEMRGLKDIRPGPVDEALFSPPADWTQVKPPVAPAQGGNN